MDYYLTPAISNSSLNYIDPEMGGCPEMMKDYLDGKLTTKRKKFLTLGQAVHVALLEPELLKIAGIPAPSDTIKEIIDIVFDRIKAADVMDTAPELAEHPETILDVVIEKEYQKNWKDDTRVAKVVEQGTDYFNHLRDAGDGFILDARQAEQLDKIKHNIISNPVAKSLLEGLEGYEMLTEEEVFWSERVDPEQEFSLDLKAKLDRLYINQETGYFHILDVKTTSKSIWEFHQAFQDRKYYRQIAYYEKAAQQILKSKYPDKEFKAGTHYILTIQTLDYFNVRVFKVGRKSIEKGNAEIKRLFAILARHFQTGNWLYPFEETGEQVFVESLQEVDV